MCKFIKREEFRRKLDKCRDKGTRKELEKVYSFIMTQNRLLGKEIKFGSDVVRTSGHDNVKFNKMCKLNAQRNMIIQNKIVDGQFENELESYMVFDFKNQDFLSYQNEKRLIIEKFENAVMRSKRSQSNVF